MGEKLKVEWQQYKETGEPPYYTLIVPPWGSWPIFTILFAVIQQLHRMRSLPLPLTAFSAVVLPLVSRSQSCISCFSLRRGEKEAFSVGDARTARSREMLQ